MSIRNQNQPANTSSTAMMLAVSALDLVCVFLVWLIVGFGLTRNHIEGVVFWAVFIAICLVVVERAYPEQGHWTAVDIVKYSAAYLILLGLFSFSTLIL